MENPHVQAADVRLLRRLSVWTKQLTLEWPLDWVTPGDIGRAAYNSGWRSPTDKVSMMVGLVAEMFVHGLATNDIDENAHLSNSVDFRNICKGSFVDYSQAPPEEDWGFPYPASGTVVLLLPTPLGLAVSDAVDPDVGLVTYEDRQPWIDQFVPVNQSEERNLKLPGAVARVVSKMVGRLPFSSRAFFGAAEKLGYEDERDQAVAGFGALAQLVTTGAIVPGRLVQENFLATDEDMAAIFDDLVHPWFFLDEVDKRSEDNPIDNIFFILKEGFH